MTSRFPPADYVQTKSTVDGITVFKPRPPEEDDLQSVVAFRCPQCDATTAYSAANGAVTCQHCGYYEPPEQEVVGDLATQFEFKVETLERNAHGWGIARKELECKTCGARTTISTEMLTHTCPFCDSNAVVQVKAAQDELRPRFLIPFQVDAETASKQKREWLGTSWMTPGTLQRTASEADFVPIYVPFWTFDARTTADWKAEVGHRRTRTYYSNGQRRTRTEIVWKWESGAVNIFTDDLIIEGTDKVSPLLLRQLSNFRTDGLVRYDPSFLAGISAQAYDINLEKSWEKGRDVIRQRTKAACESQASTDLVRNFAMNMSFSEESWRYVLLPVYIAVYHYQNEAFKVMVNGQTGKVVGQRPVDWAKVWLAIAACMLPGLFLAIVGLILLFVGIGVIVLPFAGFAFLFGFRYARQFYNQAEAMDDV